MVKHVPGDSPDGMGVTVRANGDGLFQRLLSAVPVGGSPTLRSKPATEDGPTGAGESPALPVVRTRSQQTSRDGHARNPGISCLACCKPPRAERAESAKQRLSETSHGQCFQAQRCRASVDGGPTFFVFSAHLPTSGRCMIIPSTPRVSLSKAHENRLKNAVQLEPPPDIFLFMELKEQALAPTL